MIYLLIVYMWLYIHRPYEVWLWLGELRVERIYMLFLLAVWLLLFKKEWRSNRLNGGVLLFASAFTLATLFGQYSGFDSVAVQNYYKILIFYVILVSSIKSIRDMKLLVVSFVVIMGLFEIHSLYEYICGRGAYRMGIWRMIGVGESLSDPNSFAASVNYVIPMIFPCFVLTKEKWQRVMLFGLLLLSVFCIGLTGSRTGFAGLLFLIGIYSAFSSYRWKLIPIFLIFLLIFWFNLPEELQLRFRTLIDPSLGPANAEASAVSRLLFFDMAIEIWKNNILFGVGPGGFSEASETGMQSHSLYAQLLSEVGLAGIVAFIFLVFCFVRNYFDAKRIYQNNRTNDSKFLCMVIVATTVAILQLLFLGLGGHNLFRFTWIWYAAFSVLSLNLLSKIKQNT